MQVQNFVYSPSDVASVKSSALAGAGLPVEGDGGFASAMQQVQTSRGPESGGLDPWSQASDALLERPSVKSFMDRTGLSFLDAAELLYGVVGSNTDTRDWAAIMRSADPVAAVRAATAAMYGLSRPMPMQSSEPVAADLPVQAQKQGQTLAQAGNFALTRVSTDPEQEADIRLTLVSLSGVHLRDAGSKPQEVARSAWLFGFDTEPLAALAQQAVEAPVSLRDTMRAVAVSGPALAPPGAADPWGGVDQALDAWMGRSLSSAGFVDARQYLMALMGPPAT